MTGNQQEDWSSYRAVRRRFVRRPSPRMLETYRKLTSASVIGKWLTPNSIHHAGISVQVAKNSIVNDIATPRRQSELSEGNIRQVIRTLATSTAHLQSKHRYRI